MRTRGTGPAGVGQGAWGWLVCVAVPRVRLKKIARESEA